MLESPDMSVTMSILCISEDVIRTDYMWNLGEELYH